MYGKHVHFGRELQSMASLGSLQNRRSWDVSLLRNCWFLGSSFPQEFSNPVGSMRDIRDSAVSKAYKIQYAGGNPSDSHVALESKALHLFGHAMRGVPKRQNSTLCNMYHLLPFSTLFWELSQTTPVRDQETLSLAPASRTGFALPCAYTPRLQRLPRLQYTQCFTVLIFL